MKHYKIEISDSETGNLAVGGIFEHQLIDMNDNFDINGIGVLISQLEEELKHQPKCPSHHTDEEI